MPRALLFAWLASVVVVCVLVVWLCVVCVTSLHALLVCNGVRNRGTRYTLMLATRNGVGAAGMPHSEWGLWARQCAHMAAGCPRGADGCGAIVLASLASVLWARLAPHRRMAHGSRPHSARLVLRHARCCRSSAWSHAPPPARRGPETWCEGMMEATIAPTRRRPRGWCGRAAVPRMQSHRMGAGGCAGAMTPRDGYATVSRQCTAPWLWAHTCQCSHQSSSHSVINDVPGVVESHPRGAGTTVRVTWPCRVMPWWAQCDNLPGLVQTWLHIMQPHTKHECAEQHNPAQHRPRTQIDPTPHMPHTSLGHTQRANLLTVFGGGRC